MGKVGKVRMLVFDSFEMVKRNGLYGVYSCWFIDYVRVCVCICNNEQDAKMREFFLWKNREKT